MECVKWLGNWEIVEQDRAVGCGAVQYMEEPPHQPLAKRRGKAKEWGQALTNHFPSALPAPWRLKRYY